MRGCAGGPAQHHRLAPWAYARARSTRRTEIARLFRRLKGFRRLFSRFETLDVLCVACINFALIVEGLRSCSHALVEPNRPDEPDLRVSPISLGYPMETACYA
jgi:hypothetical protein